MISSPIVEVRVHVDFHVFHPTSLLSRAVDVVFPARCAGCGHRGVWVCDECEASTRAIARPLCERCGAPSFARCRCDELNPAIELARAAMIYEGWVRRAVHLFKYENEPARAAGLASFMAPAAIDLASFDAIVPAPLHASRLRGRGYNQARLLADHLGPAIGKPVDDCLIRTRATDQQVGLDRAAREINVAGAFAIRDGAMVVGKRVVLIDDVMTTGSTLNACADALAAGGAACIGVLTLAREI